MKLPLALVSALAMTASAAVQAPPLPDAAPLSKEGLTLTFTGPEGKSDTRQARLMALFVPAGQAPTPFLPAGSFTAKWEGEITSPLRAQYTFTAEAAGSFKLSINGAPVLDDASAKSGKTVQLNKGPNKVVAELVRPEKGDAALQLKWSSKEFPPEPVPPTVFTHDANGKELRTGERLREGRLLFAQMHCAACHDGGDLLPPKGEGMPELAQDAPIFGNLGAMFNEAWLAHWISDPHSIRPSALMPKVFEGKPGEVPQPAADLAAYFASLGVPAEGKPLDPGLAGEGGALFANLGCVACHQKPDAEGQDEHGRVPLSHVKAKWQPPALEAYLKDPAANYKWTRMPHFRLSDDEAQRLTVYLLTSAARDFPPAPKGDASKAGPLLVASGCLNCHAGMPPMTTPKLAATLAGGWNKGCVAPTAATRGKAPDFGLTPAQREALVAFASSGFGSLKQDPPVEFAERQVRNLRCTACHSRDGEASILSKLDDETAPLQAAAPLEEGEGKPTFSSALPPLTWFGEKLQPAWAATFIAGHADYKPRPWLINRMPGFATVAEPIAQGLAFEHGLPLADPAAKLDDAFVKAGETLLGENGGFNCTTCHGVLERGATAVFEAPGINLGYTRERIRHGYYSRWVLFPQRIDPETKMPRFADDDGKTPLADQFDGKASEQFEAIWQYLQAVKK
ncbi:MAG: hypothetical protein QOE70_3893 [Chthoniobacter sp.]|jgi:mono/diheme cytochrome c family protein|nr:hypothetical protein [Chthoniobacter sp.]